MIENNRQNAHQEIDHIFKKLLPAHGMAERPVQVALSHRMPVSYTHLEKTQYLLRARYILNKSGKEIAADLKMSPDNVRMAIVRAKRKAKKAMEAGADSQEKT